MNRLVQWDPFRIRLDAGAVEAVLRERLGAKTKLALTFEDGAIEVVAASLHARVTLVTTSPNELRLSVAINDAPPAIVVSVSVAALLPPFVDVTIAAAEITKDGVLVSLGRGGADPPS